jgi:hypothetical protein
MMPTSLACEGGFGSREQHHSYHVRSLLELLPRGGRSDDADTTRSLPAMVIVLPCPVSRCGVVIEGELVRTRSVRV